MQDSPANRFRNEKRIIYINAKRLMKEDSIKTKYKVGQVWKYETRRGEENSNLTITCVENNEKLGVIISVYIEGIKISNSKSECNLEEIQHLPFSEKAIDESVVELIETRKKLPKFKDGYNNWKRAFERNEAGIFTIKIKESIEFVEKTINEGDEI